METGRFKVAWWNTRLTPPKGSKVGADEASFIFNEVALLLKSGVDVLGLGEVDNDDVDAIAKIVTPEFEVRRYVLTDIGRRFHMCLITKIGGVAVHSASAFARREGRRTFRIAVRASLSIHDLSFEVYFVHWPSRLYAETEGFDRNFFGFALREEIDEKMAAGRANVIVIGDFNDEPYNTSMNARLLATRDPVVARKTPDLLYNPFWKRMAPTVGHDPASTDDEPYGSHFYTGNSLIKWHTLDQLLVSGTFLGSIPWHLHEAETDVWRPAELVKRVASSKHKVDHLPVVGTFVRI